VTTHDEADCPHCQDCPGCEGGCAPELIKNPVVIRISRGFTTIICGDCDGEGIVCSCICHTV